MVDRQSVKEGRAAAMKVRGKRSERTPRVMTPKGAVQRVGRQPGVPDRRKP